MTAMAYDDDIAAWAQEQARLLGAGHFDAVDRISNGSLLLAPGPLPKLLMMPFGRARPTQR